MCDDVMRQVMKKLELETPPFMLKRLVKVNIGEEKGKNVLHVEGVDTEGTPYSLFSKVVAKIGASTNTLEKEPFNVFDR